MKYKTIEINTSTGEVIESELTEEELNEYKDSLPPAPEIESEPPLSPQERLSNLGLTVDDLKSLLGLE